MEDREGAAWLDFVMPQPPLLFPSSSEGVLGSAAPGLHQPGLPWLCIAHGTVPDCCCVADGWGPWLCPTNASPLLPAPGQAAGWARALLTPLCLHRTSEQLGLEGPLKGSWSSPRSSPQLAAFLPKSPPWAKQCSLWDVQRQLPEPGSTELAQG